MQSQPDNSAPVSSEQGRLPLLRAAIRQYLHTAGKKGSAIPVHPFLLARPAMITAVVHHNHAWATSTERRRIGALVEETSRDSHQRTMHLHAGATLLWDLPAMTANRRMVVCDGMLPLRIAAFDRHYALLEHAVVGENGAAHYQLRSEASLVVLSAYRKPSKRRSLPPQLAGWQLDSPMIQANPVAWLAEDVVVRTNSPIYSGRGQQRVACGVMRAADMIERNWLEGSVGSRERGWIETWLPRSIQTIALLVRRESVPDRAPGDPVEGVLARHIRLADTSSGLQYINRLLPAAYAATAYRAAGVALSLVLYETPGAIDDHQALLRLRAEPQPGWICEGVLGINRDIAQVPALWPKLRLEHHAAFSPMLRPPLTRVELI